MLRAIAKKEFEAYLALLSDQEKQLFLDFFYEGVTSFRSLGRKFPEKELSLFFEKKILSVLEEIVRDKNRLARLLGFLYEYCCERVAPMQISHTECELLLAIFSRLHRVPNLSLGWYRSVFSEVHKMLKQKPKPRGLVLPKNKLLVKDAAHIMAVLT